MGKEKDKTSSVDEDGTQVKVIKRYTNRKLYDTVESRYVTLEEIAEMIRAGEDVRIIDNRSKEDLTSVTFAQIIFEQEKKAGQMPLSLLRDIVRHGEASVQTFIEREIQPRVASIREEAEQRFTRVFRRDKDDDGPPATEKEIREYVDSFVAGFRRSIEDSQHRMLDWQQRIGEMQTVVDERVQRALQSVSGLPALHKDLKALRSRLDEIEAKISQLDEK